MLWISHSRVSYRSCGFPVAFMWLQSKSQLCCLTFPSTLPTLVKSGSLLYVFWPQVKGFLGFLCASFHLDCLWLPYTWHSLEPTQVYDWWSHDQIYHIGFIHSHWSHPRNTRWFLLFIRYKTACSAHRADEDRVLSPQGRLPVVQMSSFPQSQEHY